MHSKIRMDVDECCERGWGSTRMEMKDGGDEWVSTMPES